jgi:hypothetical protein
MAQAEGKIAVVLIHGIGDQRPMATLRSFVEAVLEPKGDDKPLYWSKPDAISNSFELRRYHAPGGGRPPIDFYEYYWANKMEGNALSHTLQWVNKLLLRWPTSVPPVLRDLWFLSWGILSAGIALAIYFWGWTPAGVLATIAAAGLAIAKIVADLALRNWLGDAARYFDDRPQNVGVRESIRRGGVDLLQKLHDTGDYRRVIVVGHSLGSAIALDILYHYWSLARERHDHPETVDQSALATFEAMLKSPTPPTVSEVRQKQKALWQELRQLGVPWRVTDLITLGSPLTHLPFLTGLDRARFDARLEQRELPKCPPVLDGKGIAYWTLYQAASGKKRSIGTLHHAACFAATRWTNFYFEHDGLLKGDPVGGPLRDLFGYGVDDRPVRTRHWRGRLNHLDYWRDDPRDMGADDAPLRALRIALSFNEGFGPRKRPEPAAP